MKRIIALLLSHVTVGCVCLVIGMAIKDYLFPSPAAQRLEDMMNSIDEPKVDVLCAGVYIPAGTVIQRTMLARTTRLSKELDLNGLIRPDDHASAIGRTVRVSIQRGQEIKQSDLVDETENSQHPSGP